MAGVLGAHGYDPGPTQRPLLAGALSGLLATAPAIAILILFGSLTVEAEILHLSPVATLVAGEVVMAIAGAAYARLFGRAANDKKGGWLFGLAFGFLLWSAGAVMILPLLGGGRAPAGEPAIGLFLSLVLWGGALGLLLPYIQKPLRNDLERMSGREESGPAAAARGRERGRQL
jgi:hypothetical protein